MSIRRPQAQPTLQPPTQSRRGEHLPTLALSAFWFWIVLLVLICGCGALFVSFVPIFPQHTAAPPLGRATVPIQSGADTSAPTAAPSAAATAPPTQAATSAPVTGQVIEDTVNVRSTPDTQGSIVGKLKKNQKITLIGRTDDSQWYQTTIAASENPVWIFADTLQVVDGDPSALPVASSP